jgi:hypothetical protein
MRLAVDIWRAAHKFGNQQVSLMSVLELYIERKKINKKNLGTQFL